LSVDNALEAILQKALSIVDENPKAHNLFLSYVFRCVVAPLREAYFFHATPQRKVIYKRDRWPKKRSV
jgi:hypothetical protein